MKRQNLAALIASVFVLAACSGSEPTAEQPAESAVATEATPVASETSTEMVAPADVPPVEADSVATEPAASAASAPNEAAAPAELSKDEQIKLGKAVYDSNCLACHGIEGKGVEGTFPPLEKSDYFAKDTSKIIHAVTKGVNGKVVVNGKEYNGIMPAVSLNDQDVANVVTYVLNSFGNAGGQVTAEDVAKAKAQ